MVISEIDTTKYEFTTKNILDQFNIEEEVIYTKGTDLKFFFKKEIPYLLIKEKEYKFESNASVVFFLHKLSLNRNLIALISDYTLARVANEVLKQLPNFHLLIDNNTDQILTVTPLTTSLISWKKIIKTIYEVFLPLDEKKVYLTPFTGLSISIKMNDDSSDLDIIKIEPQNHSSITVYRNFALKEISLRGYGEEEIMANLKEKLQYLISIDSKTS